MTQSAACQSSRQVLQEPCTDVYRRGCSEQCLLNQCWHRASQQGLYDNKVSMTSRPFTPDLKLIWFTNSFLHSLSWFHLDCLHGSWTRTGHWHLFAIASLFIFFGFLVLVVCARFSWSHSAFQSTLNSPIVSYCQTRVHYTLYTADFYAYLCRS